MTRIVSLIMSLVLGWPAIAAQTPYRVVHYDEKDGVPSIHITQLLQDDHGFMWFSTWNGLCRFDGYEFHTFKPQAGDGCHITNDRIRNIAFRPDGQIICRVEDDEYHLFDTRTYRFHDIAPQDTQQIADDLRKYRQCRAVKNSDEDHHITFELEDRQGNLWQLGDGQISLCVPIVKRTQRLAIEPAAEVKCLFRDSKNRYWLTTREDAAVRIYNSEMQLMGYLGRDGIIRTAYTSFGAAVYCMYETTDSTLWMGSKPYGLFRMQEQHGRFVISQPAHMSRQDVYNIKEDRWGRLWIATMREGLFFTSDYRISDPHFLVPQQYPKDYGQRVRYLHITRNGVLIAAATDGLIVAKLENDVKNMRFHRYKRESDRSESLSSSAIMDIMENSHGDLWISTESGGVNIVSEPDLLKPQPVFHHVNMANHLLPNDVVQSLVPINDQQTIVVSSHLLTLLDTTGHSRVLDARYFNADYRFGDARPLPFGKDQWLFGLKNGAFTISSSQMEQKAYSPKLALTYIEIRGKKAEVRGNWAIDSFDTIRLQPHERNVNIRFAALDYSAPERINYAFRLSTQHQRDSSQWNYIGHDRSATLLDMEPGSYLLEIRSTNSDGEWQENHRHLTIIVEPTFWEAWYGQLLVILLVVGVLSAAVYTLLYIKRIKHQHRETLEAYLALMESSSVPEMPAPPVTSEFDPMLRRVMQFIEENLSDGSIGVGDMAAAAAVSRSGLQRKLKQTMGVTPQELLSEARIKHACQLLRQTDKPVAEIAYSCGFNDPKYFSRCFKQSTGKTPSEYKKAL